ncbi:MAG: hypothetical protein BGP04_17070 [Rhizobiales bacterium 62-17]|nr:hypothetical protein [Hyphomicrobiales bacterium]OJY03442.1 MAG: hypothetical protein BGP04_17070 [Rhizobiales bacterium 62-17]
MSDASSLYTFTISPNGPVFDLPLYVARDEGLFEKHGLKVEFAKAFDPLNTSKDPFQRQKEVLYESGKASAYNLCEWAGLDRSEKSGRGSRVFSLRPAVAAQALVTFDEDIQEPRDLEGVAIGINELTGSHYTTLQLLEGTIPREGIILEHAGSPHVRYDALKRGEIKVIAIMEPFISLALKEGAHIVAVNYYRGSEVISPEVPEQYREAYVAAVNEAADRIKANFDKYKHHIVKQVEGKLKPEELFSHFVHYTRSKPLDEKRFDYTYEWMKTWNLTPGISNYHALVA